MHRRQLLQLFGGLAVGGLARLRAQPRTRRRIVVAGGGIIGASIAYHLARRGASVRVLEKTAPAAGATQNSFAWINAGFSKRPREYYRLNHLSMLAYRQLALDLGDDLPVQWGGSLAWSDRAEATARLERQVRARQAWGYPVHLVDDAEFRRLEPGVVRATASPAVHATEEGNVDPVAATLALLAAAEAAGAEVEYPCEITGLDLSAGGLTGVTTTQGPFEADALVIAAGVATPRLAALAGLDVPLKESPGLLAHTDPADRSVGRVVLAPGAHVKQKHNGRFVVGAGLGETAVADNPDEAPPTDTSAERGRRMLDAAARVIPAIAGATLDRVTLGFRPLPRDNYPVVGFAERQPDVYLAVMHSGVTLAPLVGRLAAQEILDDVRVDLLAPYRVERFG
jgi:glycine/D-amino acid oxidase-like deaminating enzyme